MTFVKESLFSFMLNGAEPKTGLQRYCINGLIETAYLELAAAVYIQ